MRHVEWIKPSQPAGFLGMVGATADNPKVYADCNLAAPSETGKEIIKRLQAMLQRQMPDYNVKQTGFLDAETCAAWRDSPTGQNLARMGITYPSNFNVTNILDTLDGASVDADGNIQHHWVCQSQMISPDCSKVAARETPTTAKKKSKAGLLLLAGAAAAALAYAMS